MKRINKIKLLLNIIFSALLGFVLGLCGIHWYHLSYWVISTTIQIISQDTIEDIASSLDKKLKKKLKFKEFVSEDKEDN